MRRATGSAVLALGALLAGAGCAERGPDAPPRQPGAAERVRVSPDSDPRAIEIAQAVVEKLGGWEAWDRTRYVRWRFFGGRLHYWDRWSGNVRIGNIKIKNDESGGQDVFLILMNAGTRRGRVWKNGEELPAGEELERWLQRGHEIWVNDSYWMFMPYKLLDPGVTLRYAGEDVMEDGRAADVLELTFADGVGYTPQNRYRVYVARDTGLVEQWDFYADAADEEPRFKMPWTRWKRFGEIFLATDHGSFGEREEVDWEIAVYEELAPSVFESPDPATP